MNKARKPSAGLADGFCCKHTFLYSFSFILITEYIRIWSIRKAIRRAFKKAHIPLNDWKVAALKTGSDVFSKAVFECRNLDELNLLGYWMSQFPEEEYYAYFDLCDAGCAEGQRIANRARLSGTITMTKEQEQRKQQPQPYRRLQSFFFGGLLCGDLRIRLL